jgi:peptide/nickel transport system substrate-binding protein
MEQLGFKMNLRLVPADTLYTKFCGVPSQNVAICPSVGWFRDFADAQSINAAMKAAAVTPIGPRPQSGVGEHRSHDR